MDGTENHLDWHFKLCYCLIIVSALGQLGCYTYNRYVFLKLNEIFHITMNIYDTNEHELYGLILEQNVQLDGEEEKHNQQEMQNNFDLLEDHFNSKTSNIESKNTMFLHENVGNHVFLPSEREPMNNRRFKRENMDKFVATNTPDLSIEYKTRSGSLATGSQWVWLSSTSRIPVSVFLKLQTRSFLVFLQQRKQARHKGGGVQGVYRTRAANDINIDRTVCKGVLCLHISL